MQRRLDMPKRVVSKIAYLGHVSKNTALFTSGAAVFLLGGISAMVGFVGIVGIFLMWLGQWSKAPPINNRTVS